MPSERNALPLLLTVSETFTEGERETSFESRVVHAAVHGWMEGHLSSPGHQLDPDHVGEMPEPPFPSQDDPQLKEIVEEDLRRFREAEEAAAVAFAAALGWQAGRATAGECPWMRAGRPRRPVCNGDATGSGRDPVSCSTRRPKQPRSSCFSSFVCLVGRDEDGGAMGSS